MGGTTINRKILFQAKRKDDVEWVKGFYYCDNRLPNLPSHVIISKDDYCTINQYEVIPETVCQYTGLKDKNGVKIFEGDIINDIDYGIMQCVYKCGSFIWLSDEGFYIKFISYVPIIEIIGNIFDNPELLEGE